MATFTTENIYLWRCIIVRKEKKCVTCGKMYYCESVIARCTRAIDSWSLLGCIGFPIPVGWEKRSDVETLTSASSECVSYYILNQPIRKGL